MNDHPSGDNANASPSSQAGVDRIPERLNLSLQQALGCLDIKLEDELNRFRTRQIDRTHDLQSIAANVVTGKQRSSDDPNSEIITGEIVRSALSNTNINDAQPELPQSVGGFIIIDGIYAPQDNLSAITRVDSRSSAQADLSHPHESMELNFSPRGEIATYDREYSASSQELLRQIQSGYATPVDNFATKPEPATVSAKKYKLFTPLKVGSLAAVCALAGGAAAYTYFNPGILASLTASKTSAPVSTSSSLGQSIQSPNLAATEFTDLNLSTLNTVKMPTTAMANPSAAPTSIANAPTTGAPVAIPYNGMNNLPATIVAQPRLADSLIRSLLPPNFHTFAKQTRYPASQPGLRR